MLLNGLPFGVTNWSQVPESVHPGASGTAMVRSRQLGDIQLRLVVYSPNYVADHWCHKGHIVFVILGQLTIEHRETLTYTLESGTSYHVADDDGPPHRVLSENGATIFIVD
jgi:hypothetical protein